MIVLIQKIAAERLDIPVQIKNRLLLYTTMWSYVSS